MIAPLYSSQGDRIGLCLSKKKKKGGGERRWLLNPLFGVSFDRHYEIGRPDISEQESRRPLCGEVPPLHTVHRRSRQGQHLVCTVLVGPPFWLTGSPSDALFTPITTPLP